MLQKGRDRVTYIGSNRCLYSGDSRNEFSNACDLDEIQQEVEATEDDMQEEVGWEVQYAGRPSVCFSTRRATPLRLRQTLTGGCCVFHVWYSTVLATVR